MRVCPRCLRAHSGICGIPPGVTRGYGARISSIDRAKPVAGIKASKPGAGTLKGLLEWGERELVKVKELLKSVPPEMVEEYNQLQDRLEKLTSALEQIRRQLAEREK